MEDLIISSKHTVYTKNTKHDGTYIYFRSREDAESLSEHLFALNIVGRSGNKKFIVQEGSIFGVILTLENIMKLYDHIQIDNVFVKAKLLTILMESNGILVLEGIYRNTHPSINNMYKSLCLFFENRTDPKNITFEPANAEGQGSSSQPHNIYDTFKLANTIDHGGLRQTYIHVSKQIDETIITNYMNNDRCFTKELSCNDVSYTLLKCMELSEQIVKTFCMSV